MPIITYKHTHIHICKYTQNGEKVFLRFLDKSVIKTFCITLLFQNIKLDTKNVFKSSKKGTHYVNGHFSDKKTKQNNDAPRCSKSSEELCQTV